MRHASTGSRSASLITHLAHFGGRMDIALDTLEESTVVPKIDAVLPSTTAPHSRRLCPRGGVIALGFHGGGGGCWRILRHELSYGGLSMLSSNSNSSGGGYVFLFAIGGRRGHGVCHSHSHLYSVWGRGRADTGLVGLVGMWLSEAESGEDEDEEEEEDGVLIFNTTSTMLLEMSTPDCLRNRDHGS